MIDSFNLKGVVMEDFCNYWKPSMFLISSVCNWKCCLEQGLDIRICQNSPLAQQPVKSTLISKLYDSYINNPISKAIVIGGLEPFMQMEEVLSFVKYFREKGCEDDIVIYTGYTEEEFYNFKESRELSFFKNIIIKFGRYVPNQKSHLDPVLQVDLASDNQYAKRI